MRISTLLSSAALFLSGVSAATVSPFAPRDTLLGASGCGSSGPLGGGHFVWFITVRCNPGDSLLCQATNSGGCILGDASRIGSMEVDNPATGVKYTSGTHTASLPFICPGPGQVNCRANFNSNNDGPGWVRAPLPTFIF